MYPSMHHRLHDQPALYEQLHRCLLSVGIRTAYRKHQMYYGIGHMVHLPGRHPTLADTPRQATPPGRHPRILWDMVNEREVRILLECILVVPSKRFFFAYFLV